jgi:hypothetical protein
MGLGVTEKFNTFSTFFAMGASLSWVERGRTPKLKGGKEEGWKGVNVRGEVGRRGREEEGGGGGKGRERGCEGEGPGGGRVQEERGTAYLGVADPELSPRGDSFDAPLAPVEPKSSAPPIQAGPPPNGPLPLLGTFLISAAGVDEARAFSARGSWKMSGVMKTGLLFLTGLNALL